MYILVSKFRFLEFWLLLSQVASYYSSLPRTVWFFLAPHPIDSGYTEKIQFWPLYDGVIKTDCTKHVDVSISCQMGS